MEQLQPYLGYIDALILKNELNILLGICIGVAVALLLSLWSLIRRRGVHSLRRKVRDLEHRLAILEAAETRRVMEGINSAAPFPLASEQSSGLRERAAASSP